MKELIMRGGKLSHSKLLVICAFAIASFTIVTYTLSGALTADLLGVYLGAFVANAIGSSATTAYRDRPADRPHQIVDNPDGR